MLAIRSGYHPQVSLNVQFCMMLDEVSALTNTGSLLSPAGEIVSSYDLEVSDTPARGFRALGQLNGICNGSFGAFDPDYATQSHVHVINGMGVTLGDSIIGLTALNAIARRYPHLRFTLYRPARAPRYVKRLYELAAPLFGTVVDLPVRLDALPQHELRIDIGNHLFWPDFSSLPMIDFFLKAMGVNPPDIAGEHKRNHWLQDLALPAAPWNQRDYVLLCPNASTPVRSIAPSVHADLVDKLWTHFGIPVAGFGAIEHPHYTDVTALSPNTEYFFAWIKCARYLVTSDTAAVHIAAGFDIPTTAFFTTIAPEWRARDYVHCMPITVSVPELEGLHASSRALDLEKVDRAYRLAMNQVDFSSHNTKA
jgi:hypothetical protein